MIMYYFSERIWTSVGWGRTDGASDCAPMSLGEKVAWTLAIIATVVMVFGAIIYLGPMLRAK